MKGYWLAFIAVVTFSFAVLGWVGARIYQEAPPIPERVLTSDGIEVTNRKQIELGQNVWQAMGGMQLGSIWGHGSSSRRTGQRTGCTARPLRSWNNGPAASTAATSPRSTTASAPRWSRG